MTRSSAPPPGLYESLITRDLAKVIEELRGHQHVAEEAALDHADSHVTLARHVANALGRVLASFPEKERIEKQLALVNEILVLLTMHGSGKDDGRPDDRIDPPPRELRALAPPSPTPATQIPLRPTIPLSAMDLIVNARGEPRVGNALEREIPSADTIDLLCAFVRWNGIRILERPLREHREKGRPLRVITTVYTGSTERKALDFLHSLGAEIRVSYDTRTTRLHAKAWLFHRETGFSTAYVGSSNLSRSALLDGVEWNVRLSEVASPELLTKFRGTFESYWNDPEYDPYDPARDADRFDRAIAPASRTAGDDDTPLPSLDVHPYTHQQEILEKLDAERQRHGHFRNLVVAATGTGKTIVAALDYKRQATDGRRPSLLFVAHRKEILTQSRSMFRMVLRDGSFGELYVDGHRPDEWRHVFASVQSLQSILRESPDKLDPTAFDVVIVDEFHHAEAPTYRRLLEHVKPTILLGLTATPERADGQSVLEWFGGRIAAELRLWDALERQILSPFQYFGISDNTDLSALTWKRGYVPSELEKLYTADNARVLLVMKALRDKIANPMKIRALGFCVGVAHAEFMAKEFNRLGISALAVSGESPKDEREKALAALRERRVNVLFSVDLYNEGIDLPEIDTVLFLRPTESATVFLQQLGRGLRLVDGKDCLTVLDFIGNAHRNFRFERRFRALTGAAHNELRRQIDDGFPYLPAGCSIQLDRVAKEIVVENLKRALGGRFQTLVDELKILGEGTTLARFLDETGLDVEDLYRSNDWSWTRLRREAGFPTPAEGPQEKELLRGIRRSIHHNDPERLRLFGDAFSRPSPTTAVQLPERDARMLLGLYCILSGTREPEDLAAAMNYLWQHPAVLGELRQLLAILEDRDRHLTHPLDGEMRWPHSIPLSVHARYQVADVFTAFGPAVAKRLKGFREGTFYAEATNSDIFFVTLEKTEAHYSPTTMYRDYAISPDLFHWESQSTTTVASPTGQRYLHQRENGTNVFLFVRRTRRDEDGRTAPYTFLGPADYVSHERERPIQIIWKLRRPMPADFFREAKVAAG